MSGARTSQAPPGVRASCISSTVSCAGSHTASLMVGSELLSGLCPPHRLMLLPFPEGGFIQSTNWPLCLCGSAAFAESLLPEACKVPRFATLSFASRSHCPRVMKLEGPARRHLPPWSDHWVPGTPSWAGGGSQCWRFLTVSGQTYLILSIGVFPTSKLTLSCLALLLLVLTTAESRQKISPFLLVEFLMYCCIYVSTLSCFPPPPSFSHPYYNNFLQQRNKRQFFHCLLDASYVKMQFLALFFKGYSQLHPG